MITIKEVCDRKKLFEGRNYGMGFAYLKKIDNENYETVNPLSPCKDYMNDVVYTEHTGKGIKACGLVYQKQNIFIHDRDFITIKIVEYHNGTKYADQDKETKQLSENYKNIEKLLNYVEENLGVKGLSEVKEANDGYYLLIVPKFWSASGYKISLYTLLVRMGMTYDGKITPEEFLDKYNFARELGLWTNAKPKLNKMIEKKSTPEVKWDEVKEYDVHNSGICALKIETI